MKSGKRGICLLCPAVILRGNYEKDIDFNGW